jgi:hypothetical protein
VRLSPEAGVGLIELLVSGLILSIAIIGLALMFSQGQAYLAAEVDDRIGVGLAQQKIEALRGLGFDCIPVGGPGTLNEPMELVRENSTAPGTTEGTCPTGGCCPDTPATRAARTYSEDAADHPAGTPGSGPFAFYESRVTRVECIDPSTFDLDTPQSPCADPPLAKKITVEVVPRSDAARAIRVESVLTVR